jgi:hypothetical protein
MKAGAERRDEAGKQACRHAVGVSWLTTHLSGLSAPALDLDTLDYARISYLGFLFRVVLGLALGK